MGGHGAQDGCESKPEEFRCDVYAVDDEEELMATDEEEQAESVNPLHMPFQLTLSQYLDHCITHYLYQSWCLHSVE